MINTNKELSSSIYIGGKEPTGNDRKKVWIQKGRNLFDKNKATLQCYIADTGIIYSNGYYLISDYIEVTPNTDYLYMGITAPRKCTIFCIL